MATFKGFSEVQLQRPKRSSFDLSHEKRLTTRMGRLTPILMQECVPSDSFRGSSEVLLRLAPLLAPIYDRIELYVHFFFVPNRLLWDEWEEFITGGRLGPGSTDPAAAPIPPYFDLGERLTAGLTDDWAMSSLADYIGVPNPLDTFPTPSSWNGKKINAMPWAAYQLIWMEYYRDRNFIPDDFLAGATLPLRSGQYIEADDAGLLLQLRERSYEHDYFTSALPFTQRGAEVLLPISLGGIAPLYNNLDNPPWTSAIINGVANGVTPTQFAVNMSPQPPPTVPGGGDLFVNGADFDGTTTNISDFRSAYALQVWLERNAIGGSRYTESTQAHFGVKPQDSRLQRPEYIGGGRIQVKISEVVATAWSNVEGSGGGQQVPLGNMGGHGVTYGNTNKFNYYCTEHGFIVGMMSIMNKASYQQGLPRMFQRNSFLDYPWPTFAKLGEQPVYNYELYMTPATLTEDVDGEFPVFGYQSRYADWKYVPSTNHGEFKETLLFWTLTRVFEDVPVLGSEFNKFDGETQNRIFAAADGELDGFWIYLHNSLYVKRPLPYFGTPNTLNF